MAAKRASSENAFTLGALASHLALLKSDALALDRFLAYAVAQAGVDRTKFLNRLRVLFATNRPPPSFFALLIKSFFDSQAHLGVETCRENGVTFRAPPGRMLDLKRYAYQHPAFDFATQWTMVPEGEMFRNCLYVLIHKPSEFAESALAAGVSKREAARRQKAARDWFSKTDWPEVWSVAGERRSIFYRFDDGTDPIGRDVQNYTADDDHQHACYLFEACGLVDAVCNPTGYRIFSTDLSLSFFAIDFACDNKSMEAAVRDYLCNPNAGHLERLLVFRDAQLLPEGLVADLHALLKKLSIRCRALSRQVDLALIFAHEDTVKLAPPVLQTELLLMRNVINEAVSSFCQEHQPELIPVITRLLQTNPGQIMQMGSIGKSRPDYVPQELRDHRQVSLDHLTRFLEACDFPTSSLVPAVIEQALQLRKKSEIPLNLRQLVIAHAARVNYGEIPDWLPVVGAYTLSGALLGVLQNLYEATFHCTSLTDYGELNVRRRGDRGAFIKFDVKADQSVREKWDETAAEVDQRIRRFSLALQISEGGRS